MKSSAPQSCIRLSINAAPGSGCHAEYLSHLLFSLEAIKSTVGSPRIQMEILRSVQWLQIYPFAVSIPSCRQKP